MDWAATADGVLPADQGRAALGRLAGRVAAGDPVAGLLLITTDAILAATGTMTEEP